MDATITLNGKPTIINQALTILELLNNRATDPSHVVVEVNHTILDKNEFVTRELFDGDIVEILRFVGGG